MKKCPVGSWWAVLSLPASCVGLNSGLSCAGGSKQSIEKMWDPIAYALGFLDCKDISARCMLSIFHFFATKTDASRLRMLNGSPRDRLLQPILDYITERGGSLELRTGATLPSSVTAESRSQHAECCMSCNHIRTPLIRVCCAPQRCQLCNLSRDWGVARAGCKEVLYEEGPDGTPVVTGLRVSKAGEEKIARGDVYVAALDCQGAKKLIPEPWRKFPLFDNIHQLEGVPVITVQLRCGLLHSALISDSLFPRVDVRIPATAFGPTHGIASTPCGAVHAPCLLYTSPSPRD